MLKECYKQSGVDRKELMEFELTKDLENLPNSHQLKVFFRCSAVMCEGVEEKSNKILLGKAGVFFAELSREEQELYLKMSKGCVKRAKLQKYLLEFTYELMVCFKQNDNEVMT